MRIKKIDTADLIPYANNARTHSDEQVNLLCSSIKEFGFCNPVLVDTDNGIIAGHGRVLAAKKLGMDKVPTVCLDHLTDTQKKAYILADNRMALDAGWDDELLALELSGLQELDFDLSLTGFDSDELNDILVGLDFDPGNEGDQGKLDETQPKMVICPGCGEEFDTRG